MSKDVEETKVPVIRNSKKCGLGFVTDSEDENDFHINLDSEESESEVKVMGISQRSKGIKKNKRSS